MSRRVDPANASAEADLPLFASLHEAPAPMAGVLPSAPWSNPTTSKAAAEAIRPRVATDEERVMDAIRSMGEKGATCAEVEAFLGMSHQTTSARIRGLYQKGEIYDSMTTRPTPPGRAAIVWRARP